MGSQGGYSIVGGWGKCSEWHGKKFLGVREISMLTKFLIMSDTFVVLFIFFKSCI